MQLITLEQDSFVAIAVARQSGVRKIPFLQKTDMDLFAGRVSTITVMLPETTNYD